ncbi:hypothetical protein HK405_000923, partial [Cladochytrium tenue]
SELAAAGIIASFWLPWVPPALLSFLLLLGLVAVNARDVRQFGETEYWLALIKVAAVVLFLCVGAAVDVLGFPGERPLGLEYWWSVPGAPFKDGLRGVVSVIAIAFFGFGGTVIRNDDPNLSLSAQNDDVSIAPFTLILRRAGLGPATHVMNAVILSAVASAANSALYAASRTLVALAARGQAPRIFAAGVDVRGVPWAAIAVTVAVASLAGLGIVWG